MGTSSVAAVSQSNVNVKTALRRSKPEDVTLPTVAMGEGRTKASAARKPGVLPISAGVSDLRSEDIEGVLRVAFRDEGEIEGECSWEREWENEGEVESTFFILGAGEEELGWGCRGRGLSSREKMERSSPFQRSPHWWLFW